MAGNGTTYQDIIFLRENLNDLQPFHFHTFSTHLSCHAHTFKYAGRIGRTTYGTRSALTVVLTVGLFTHTGEPVTSYNALETFTFGSTHNVDFLTFSENIAGERLSEGFSHGSIRIAELSNVTFREVCAFAK